MKLTPLDIHHKEFHHSLRGYSEEGVDAFLDEVADEFERLFKENIDMAEKLEAANVKVREYQAMEVTLNNTMVSAQRSAETIVSQASEDASTIMRDAEVKAKEIIHNALTEKQKVQGELVRIKQAEEDFRGRFRALLEQHLRGITEVSLPADINMLIGTTDGGVVADVELRREEPARVESFAPFVAEVPELAVDEAVALQVEEAVALQVEEAVAPEVEMFETAPPQEEPVSTGFVTSVGLGEIVPPDLSAEEPDFVEPFEFNVPSFDALGEREDDVDIEEID
jgi:cell division initiation protein